MATFYFIRHGQKEAGGEVLSVVTDISKPRDTQNLVSKAVEAFG